MHAECCGYILVSALALCIHVGMSACFARPLFINPLLLLVCLCALWLYITVLIVLSYVRPFVWHSIRLSVCLSVCMFTYTYVERNVLVFVLWTSKIELTWLIPCLAWVFTFLFVFRVAGQTTVAGMSTFLCKNCVYDRQKSTHIFVSYNIVLFHKSFMTVTKGKSQTCYNFLYWRALKKQHLDNSFNLRLEKEDRTIILIVC